MKSGFKTEGGALKNFLERQKRLERDEAERTAQKKAKWDALPEEEKNRILTLRHQEKQEYEKRKAEEEREEQQRKAEKEREDQRREWRRRGVTPRFYDATWENWKAETPEQKSVLEKVKQQAWKKIFS